MPSVQRNYSRRGRVLHAQEDRARRGRNVRHETATNVGTAKNNRAATNFETAIHIATDAAAENLWKATDGETDSAIENANYDCKATDIDATASLDVFVGAPLHSGLQVFDNSVINKVHIILHLYVSNRNIILLILALIIDFFILLIRNPISTGQSQRGNETHAMHLRHALFGISPI